MHPDSGLVRAEKSSHYTRYMLIIGLLVLSFSLSFMIRVAPADYGFELQEFDPFFNYRATEFIVENGLPAYLEWHDDMSWHPYGRDVSATSQVMLHVTGSTLYQTFGAGSSLYDFTMWFPVVIGSLTTVVFFALVRTIGGTTAGILASFFFAVSPIIILRGSIGWFKSEPLGLFFGLLAVYLLLSGIKSNRGKVSAAKIVGGGVLLAFGLASWGGIQFFILPIGLFFLALPFFRKDNKFVMWTSVVFTAVFILVTISFERTGVSFISSLNGFFLIGCTAFLVACIAIKKISDKTQLRNGLALLGGAVIAGIAMVSSGLIGLPTFRYLNAANPFLITADMLTDSVSEHATTTMDISFYFFSILMIFAGIGAWLLFQKKVNNSFHIKSEMAAFALIIGFLGVYFSSAFVRLEVFGAIGIIVLSSIGVSIIISKIIQKQHKPIGSITKISFLGMIVILLTIPMVYPEELNWANYNNDVPNSILHSGSHFDISTNDWPDAMQWLRENTDEDAVIASWWDYGYWINALGERKTLADNSTLIDWQIRKIASTYLSTPDDAWQILTSDTETDVSSYYVTLPSDDAHPTAHSKTVYDAQKTKMNAWETWKDCIEMNVGWNCEAEKKSSYDPDIVSRYSTLFDYWESEVHYLPPVITGLDSDYILINLAVEKLPDENIMPLYTLRQKGADETKVFWFVKIADLRLLDYYNPEITSYTDRFWDETLIGKLIPFTPVLYVDPENPELQSETFKMGYTAIYAKHVKYPTESDGPFELVYVPPSFENNEEGPMTGPLIYKINKEYEWIK